MTPAYARKYDDTAQTEKRKQSQPVSEKRVTANEKRLRRRKKEKSKYVSGRVLEVGGGGGDSTFAAA